MSRIPFLPTMKLKYFGGCCRGCLVIVFLTIAPCLPYNLENRLPLFKYGTQGSKFGFSVALHRTTADNSVGMNATLMVVGAPTAAAVGRPEIGTMPRNPGGVFYCPVSTDPGDCDRVRMDEGAGDRLDTNRIFHKKSGQWLGVNLKSQGPGKFLIACAHRYAQQRYLNTQSEKERLCGRCFLLKVGPGGIEEIPRDSAELPFEFVSSLCDIFSTNLDSKQRYSKTQFGSSIDIHDGRYVAGGPGTWAWTGSLFDFNMPTDGGSGSEMGQTPTCMPSSNPNTDERFINSFGNKQCKKIPLSRDSYMGFSVAASSSVNTDSETLFYATGAPTGNSTGVVVFYKRATADDGSDLLVQDPAKTVVGVKIGSSFGYSVALTDINKDGLDDLIVGAPQYYENIQKKEAGGAVYVYLNHPDKEFGAIEPIIFFGPPDSFFGHSVAPLDDLDQDGFNDFAVGAPYENENGTVHIFRGGHDGPKESQVIRGSDYGYVRGDVGDITGFGASLSGSVDADSNKYPDLMIGTFSDSAALLRSRPIITVTSKLDVKVEEIDLEQKTCTATGQDYSCFGLTYCLMYTARHADYPEGVAIKYTLKLDNIRKKAGERARLHFDSPKGSSTIKQKVELPRSDAEVCPGRRTHWIYFENAAEDKLTDIEIKFKFELDLPEIRREGLGAPVFDLIEDPILDADIENEKTSLVRIKTTCGDDGCQSGLKISGNMPEEVLVGDDALTLLTVNVVNDGEEAHQAHIEIYLPPNVDFVNFTIPDMSTPEMTCYSASSGESSFVKCYLGNPYKGGVKDTIEIYLSTRRLDARTKTIDITIEGDTTSENPQIQPVALQARVIVELSLSLSWSSAPDQVRYAEKKIIGESGMKTTEDIGPLIQYTFNVENNGLTPANGVVLDIQLPVEIDNGKWLLYLVASEVKLGVDEIAGICNSSYINTLRLEPALPVAALISSRAKRSAEGARTPVAQASSGGGYISTVDLACDKNTARCESIKCTMDEIPAGSTASVVMQIHVWEATFLEEFKDVDLVQIHTVVELTTENQNVRVKGDRKSGVVGTTVDHESFKSDVVAAFPWWYILIGVVILLVFYIVIIYLLVKCGFFKRKKFPRHEENEDDAVLEEEDDEEKKREEHRM